MSLFNKLFNIKSDGLKLRYSKSEDQWQVYREMSIVYMGTKEMCQEFIKNSQAASA